MTSRAADDRDATADRLLTLLWSARTLVPFLREQGIIGGPTELLWRKAHVL